MAEETAVLGSDARLAGLRERLALARTQGVGFEQAWEPAVVAALAGLAALDRATYLRALHGTRSSWQAAYERRPATRLDWALGELEGFANDGEADALAYELPAA